MDIFFNIIDGEVPSYKIYEDDIVLAFLDVNPDVNGHTLIVPKKHYKDLYDIDNDTLVHIFDVARQISDILLSKLNADGLTLVQNNGLYQEVKHFHLHLKPQYKDKKELLNPKEVYELIKA